MLMRVLLCLAVLVSDAGAVRTAPDVAEKVAQEAQQNIQIHDGFLADEKKDIVKEKQVKANKDLSALQKTSPGVEEEVARETQQNIQIHDGFLADEKKDIVKEKQVKANKDLSALQKKTSPGVEEEVARETQQNIQIHDGFAAEEKKDIVKEKQVKANKDLSALQQAAKRTAPDVAEKVAQEAQENIQIHDQFAAEEKKDIAKEKQVKANKDLSALQKKTSPGVEEEVARESQENIQIHDQFAAEEKKDIVKEKQVKANKDLSALQLSSKTSPGVEEEVARESQENIQIHDQFAAEEKKDIAKEKQVKANKDLSAVQLATKKTAPDVAEEVAREAQENIQIHDGFAAEEKKDIVKEKQVKANKDLSALQSK